MNGRTRRRRCKRCDKFRYATVEAAEADLRRIAACSAAPKVPQRAYVGPCGWVHLTSSPVRSEHGDQVDMGRQAS